MLVYLYRLAARKKVKYALAESIKKSLQVYLNRLPAKKSIVYALVAMLKKNCKYMYVAYRRR